MARESRTSGLQVVTTRRIARLPARSVVSGRMRTSDHSGRAHIRARMRTEAGENRMTTKIACVQKSAPNLRGHTHIVAVGVGYSQPPTRQTVEQVRRALATETYYTVSPSTGKIALVSK